MARGRDADVAELIRRLDPEPPDTVIANVLNFANRPGGAVRAALKGDPGLAALNLARFATDLFTGGFLKQGLNPATRIKALREARSPEAAEVLASWGVAPPAQGTWKRFGLNLAGGILTDPLTYATLGVGGVGKGAVSSALGGLRRAAPAEAAAVLQRALTPAGRAAAEAAAQARRTTPAAQRLLARGATPARERLLRQRGLEDVLGVRLRAGPEGQLAAEDAVEQLVRRGLARRPAAYFAGMRIPGTEGTVGEAARGLARWSLPGLAARGADAALSYAAPGAARYIRTAAGEAGRAVKDAAASLYNRRYVGKGAAVLGRAMTQSDLEIRAGTEQTLRWGETELAPAFGRGTDARVNDLGKATLIADDQLQQAAARSGLPPREVLRYPWAAPEGAAAQAAVVAEAERLFGPAGRAAMASIYRKFGEAADELVREGVWQNADDASPLYMPRQVNGDVRRIMGGTFSEAFEDARGYPDLASWMTHVKDVVDRYNVAEVARGRPDRVVRYTDPWDLVETDVRKLAVNRLTSHAQTIARQKVRQVAEAAGSIRGGGDELDRYLTAQWASVPDRPLAQVILGGGHLRDAPMRWMEGDWKGLNYYWKAALYAPWPGSHVGNATAAAMQAGLSPDLGPFGALGAFLKTLRYGPVVKWAKAQGVSDPVARDLIQAAMGDTSVRARVAGERFGNYSGQEVLDGLDRVIGQGGPMDIDLSTQRLERLAIEARNPRSGMARKFDRMAELAYGVVGQVENAFRSQHYLALLARGRAPVEAAEEVNRVFVDYASQGKWDRLYRDIFLFGRFPLAVVPPVARGALQKPRSVALLANLRAASGSEREQGALPERLRSGLAFRLPGPSGRWVSSLRTPFEAAADTLEGLTSPAAARRRFGGSLTPPLRVPAEAVSGVRFYHGTPWGEFRRAPGYLPDFLTTKVKGPSGTRREVPGWLNEVLDSTPLSRLEGMADMVASIGDKGASRPTASEVLLTALTGVRAQRVDERRAVQELATQVLERARERGEVGEVRRFYPRGASEPRGRTASALEVQRALDRARERRR